MKEKYDVPLPTFEVFCCVFQTLFHLSWLSSVILFSVIIQDDVTSKFLSQLLGPWLSSPRRTFASSPGTHKHNSYLLGPLPLIN